jgi:hypothetical protein
MASSLLCLSCNSSKNRAQTPLLFPFLRCAFLRRPWGWGDTTVVVYQKVQPKRRGANVLKQVFTPDFWSRVQPKSWTSETTR